MISCVFCAFLWFMSKFFFITTAYHDKLAHGWFSDLPEICIVCVNLMAFYIKPFLFPRILVGFPLLLLAYLTSFNQLQKLCLCRYETQYLLQQINVQMTNLLKSKHITVLFVALTTKCQDNKDVHCYWKWVLIIPSW